MYKLKIWLQPVIVSILLTSLNQNAALANQIVPILPNESVRS